MNYTKQLISSAALLGLFATQSFGSVVVDFAEKVLAAESNYGGAGSGAGNFSSQGVDFTHSADDFSWSGFTYSNRTDTTTAEFTNQFSAYTGSGFGDANYGISYVPLDWMSGTYDPIPQSFSFSTLADVSGMYVTNTTYAALSMLDGDGFAKRFGGESGDDPDFFKLIIDGFDETSTNTGTVEFFLADYRFADNSQDYLIDDWTFVDLSSLGDVASLSFSIDSTDAGDFGINTPTYFALDSLEFTPVPEPSAFALLAGVAALGLVAARRRG